MWIGNDKVMREELLKILSILIDKELHDFNFRLIMNCYEQQSVAGNDLSKFKLALIPFDFDEELQIEEDDLPHLWNNPTTDLIFKDFCLEYIEEESTDKNEVWGFFFNLTEAGKQYLLNKCMEAN